ncbi:MAG TPA: CHASE domain-containing protein, partial [Candidatus Synoicihabitans sp.]|nr:CHASE domain-containing protein [Candidatus Synoicihabitans sp.]
MTRPAHSDRAAFRVGELRLPLVVVSVLGVISVLGSQWVRRDVARLSHERFERVCATLVRAVQERFRPTEQGLMTLTALVENTGYTPHAAQWSTHVRLVQQYLAEGVVGLGFVKRVARGEADALETQMRGLGYPDFVLERAGAHEQLFVVTNNAPMPLNRHALGQDIASGTTRREAAEAAARLGGFALSRRIRVVSADDSVPGVLLFHPVFRGSPPVTDIGRETTLVGWVYASL